MHYVVAYDLDYEYIQLIEKCSEQINIFCED